MEERVNKAKCKIPSAASVTELTLYSIDTSTTDSENIVEKGEIARNEQFFLLPHCFILKQLIVFPFVHIFDITF